MKVELCYELCYEGLWFSMTFQPSKWPELLKIVFSFPPQTFTIKPFYVEIQKIDPQTGKTERWAKRPGFSLWRDDTEEPSPLTKPRKGKKGWYISITGCQRFVSIYALSDVKAGFKVAGLHPKSDLTYARTAVGPFGEKEAEEIVHQLNS